jgi:hypothetical protein
MSKRTLGGEVGPRVFFITDAIVGHQWGWEVDDGDTRVEKLSAEMLQQAWRGAAGTAVPRRLEASRYRVGAGAGFPDLFYFLDQMRPWLGTVADLIALGILGKAIINTVRERLGQDAEYVYFSREVLEAICVLRVQEEHSGDLGEACVQSDGFQTRFVKGEPADDPREGQVYLVWVSVSDGTYQFLMDSSGRIWAQYYVNRTSAGVERLGREWTHPTREI